MTQQHNKTYAMEIQGNAAYQQFDNNAYKYTHNHKRSWSTIAKGEFNAGPYTTPYSVRGDRSAIPAMDLPGGPASPLSTGYKEYFARNRFSITLADWRGAGLSRPLGKTHENTVDDLTEDMEKLRKMSGYDKILLRGGSWGATMAMKYAQNYPEHVSGMVIGLPFLGRPKDIEWNFGDNGAAQKYQAAFDEYMSFTGQTYWKDALQVYAQQLQHPDPKIHAPAFMEWMKWEWAKCDEIYTADTNSLHESNPAFMMNLARARIMAHYAENDFFMSENGMVDALHGISNKVPVIVVSNEHDSMSAPDTIDTMRREMPQSEFVINKGADWHWIFDPRTDSRGRDNSFVENGYAYSVEKERRILSGEDLSLNTAKAVSHVSRAQFI